MLERVTILGAGGWAPAHGRHTASALVRDRDCAVMIDAGTGVARLLERPELLDGIDRLEIVLTHFHLDHVIGLSYLPAIAGSRQTTIWGPGAALYGTTTGTILGTLSHQPLHPVTFGRQGVEIRELPLGAVVLPSGIVLRTRRQERHSAPTLGLRFGDQLAWITDTAHDPDSSRFARGCTLLAHETWFLERHPRNPESHSSAAQAATVAVEAEAQRLLLTHLPPFARSTGDLVAEAEAVFPTVLAADDGIDVALALRPERAPAGAVGAPPREPPPVSQPPAPPRSPEAST